MGAEQERLVQIHHEFRDGTTKLCRQVSCENLADVEKALKEVAQSHPLPEDAQWLFCVEGSRHFVTAVAEESP